MSIKNEFAEVVKSTDMLEWAEKVNSKKDMTKEEKEVSQIVDVWAKDIGNRGADNDLEISGFIRKVIENPTYSY